MEGVADATVNPLTGNALIFYRAGTTDGASLIEQMREREWIASAAERRPNFAPPNSVAGMDRTQLQRMLARKLFEYLAQLAIERCVVALVAALL